MTAVAAEHASCDYYMSLFDMTRASTLDARPPHVYPRFSVYSSFCFVRGISFGETLWPIRICYLWFAELMC